MMQQRSLKVKDYFGSIGHVTVQLATEIAIDSYALINFCPTYKIKNINEH